MELVEDRRKRANPGHGGGETSAGSLDRLSALPDCVLHAIMSSLKSRQAVQTCVLSKRWRHFWRSMPCLDVDFSEFKTAALDSDDDNSGSGSDESYDSDDNETSASETEWEHFEDFTINLMLCCNMAQLDSFRLNIGTGRTTGHRQRQAGGWLRRAMKFSTPDPPVRREGWSSNSWHLKRLYLCNVVLDNLFAEHVSSVCQSLQDLELDNCQCKINAITSHSMKKLVLRKCRWTKLSEITTPTLETLAIDGGSNTHSCLLVILAPAVAYLQLAVNVLEFRGGISINEMPSLVKASIHLQCHMNYNGSELGGDQLKLLRSVSNATSLELSGVGTTVLGKEPTVQEFKNLRNLLLGNCNLSDCTLGFFLHGSPNLEKLTLQHCEFANDSKENKGTSKLNEYLSFECHSADFNRENIKLEIIYKKDNAGAFSLVELLLRFLGNLSRDRIKFTKVN